MTVLDVAQSVGRGRRRVVRIVDISQRLRQSNLLPLPRREEIPRDEVHEGAGGRRRLVMPVPPPAAPLLLQPRRGAPSERPRTLDDVGPEKGHASLARCFPRVSNEETVHWGFPNLLFKPRSDFIIYLFDQAHVVRETSATTITRKTHRKFIFCPPPPR